MQVNRGKITGNFGMALFVFTLMSGILLWMTGYLRLGAQTASATQTEAHEEAHGEASGAAHGVAQGHDHEGEAAPSSGDHSEECADCEEAEGADIESVGKTAKESWNAQIAAIEKENCEHGGPIVECDKCRFEAGVVKVIPSVSGGLIASAPVEEREAVNVLRLNGEIQHDPTRVVEVTPIVSGRIAGIRAELGQTVQAGDVLAVILSPELGEARATCGRSAAALEIARKEQQRQSGLNEALEALLRRLDAEGGAGDFGSSDADGVIGEWKSKLLGAAARLKVARSALKREEELHEMKISSAAEHESADQEFQTAQAEYNAFIEEVRLNLALDKLRADRGVQQAEADLAAAQSRLKIMGISPDAPDDGEPSRLEVKAPRSGTIIAAGVSEGKFAETSTTLFTVADLGSLWVWCDLYERDLSGIHAALASSGTIKAVIRVAAFKDRAFEGTADLIGSEFDEHTRTVKVRIRVANPDRALSPGMFAHAEIPLPLGRRALVIPNEALLSDEGRFFVFKKWRDDMWVRRDVRPGRSQGGFVEIVAGVAGGDVIVTRGAFMLKSDVLRGKMGAGCAD
ncbi:MAG TPA: efflux RND transporter periplasmic adaptor subunit [Candidatus Brocadiia bacterium]|nr:efflux RND transporter periplasmic adaptor subunit [Candidatus Brocadiia bacterium]